MGDTPEAACYESPEEPDYRHPAHTWRSLMKDKTASQRIECCDKCGAMRTVNWEEPKEA